ncbi:unnamed protein product [Schistosoma margrebowiei]|uniref:Uncharacterized protein n=1 Tax=Schistosoma margrebowiei TaxID=48269 RepID=A0A183LDN0_9TREM|nr:unnamed protein product [Schistosoma margrebowiei]
MYILTIFFTVSDSFHIFVGDLAPEVQDETLLAAFSNFGTITEYEDRLFTDADDADDDDDNGCDDHEDDDDDDEK